MAAGAVITWCVNWALDRGADAVEDDALVTAFVESDPARVFAGAPGWQTYDFVSRKEPTDLGPPPSARCRDWRKWALRNGGADADETTAYAYLQARSNAAIVIDAIEIEIVRRRPAVRGTSAHCPAGGATGNPRLIDIDLDANPPAVVYAEAGDDYPARKRLSFTLRSTETEILHLRAHTARCDCEWRARVQAVVNGRRDELVLDDDGSPFRTSSSRRTKHVLWDGKRWAPMRRADWKRTLPMNWAEFAARQER